MRELRAAHVVATVEAVTEGQDITLPYHWDRMHDGRSGEAMFEIPFSLDELPDVPYGALFPRVGNTAEIWLNGNLLATYGDMRRRNIQDYVKVPQFVQIPSQLLQRDNMLRVRIHADGGRRAGLTGVIVGPDIEVRERYDRAYRWRMNGLIAVAVFSLVVGVIALLLWLTQKETLPGKVAAREGLYLSAGLAELCWMVRMTDAALVEPPLAWPWWGMLQHLAYAGFVFSAGLFCHRVAGWHLHPSMRWVRIGVWGMVLVLPLLSYLALTQHEDLYLTSWYGFVTLLFAVYCLFYVVAAVRHPTTERLLVTTAGVLNVLVGARDWLVIRAADNNFEQTAWMRFSSVLFGLALGYIIITRFREASEKARDLMNNMAAKVKEKELELNVSYQQLEKLAREQERTAERARILRDMHDGVGSHISSAIRQLQSGKASNEQLLLTLRDSLDQLKLSIDAMNLPPGDVTALLANLRYRLEPRFKASDITFHWDVELMAPLAALDAKAMRQLQFMVFEALSNVLQHAQASELRIELRAVEDGGASLRVIDNGCGFDPAGGSRKGLSSLRERAAAIGAQLMIESAPGGTKVEIVLPGVDAG
jgi:hypothetical protein